MWVPFQKSMRQFSLTRQTRVMTYEYEVYDKYDPGSFSTDWVYLRAHGVGCLDDVADGGGHGF
jgi:hypothetical protein